MTVSRYSPVTTISSRLGTRPKSRRDQVATVSRGCHSSGQPGAACYSRMVNTPLTTMALSVRL